MALRLILVSMVAGLGVAPPSESELASWAHSVQVWTEARLAEWDGRQPLAGVKFEADAAAPEAEPGFQALLDELWSELADEPEPDAPAGIDEPTVSADLVFDAVVDEIVAEFARDVIAPPAPLPGPSTLATSQALVEPDRSEAEVQDDPADSSLETSEKVVMTGPLVEAEVQGPQYEPFDVGDDLYPGLAYSLNFDADGIDEPLQADIVDPIATVSDGNQLRDAVRLTRDAVYAWMNLLQSPAIVAIPR
jgi:hypothetical protein